MCTLEYFDWHNILAGAILGVIATLLYEFIHSVVILKWYYSDITGTYHHGNVIVTFKHIKGKIFHVHEKGGTNENPIEWGGIVEMFGDKSLKGTYDWNIGKNVGKPDWGEYFLHISTEKKSIHSVWIKRSGDNGAEESGSVLWLRGRP